MDMEKLLQGHELLKESLSANSSSRGSSEQLSPAEHNERRNTPTKQHNKSNNDSMAQFRSTLKDQQELKKARKIRVFRNGDKLHAGITVALNPDKYKSYEALLGELTRLLSNPTHLTAGVRVLYTLGGTAVQDISDLVDGECYVAGSKEAFVFLEYSKSSSTSWNIPQLKKPEDPISSITNDKCSSIDENREFVKPRVVTIIKNGTPRTTARILLNKKTAYSYEQVLRDITDAIKLDTGAVRKVYNLSGVQIITLHEFFEEDDVFIACGGEKLKCLTEEDLSFINEKNTIGSKSPIMTRRKSVGSKSPVLFRKLAPTKSPVLARRSIDLGNSNTPLKFSAKSHDQLF